ncbi:DUF262 domain-containing protein [Chloroflexota bacterium]|nr:DUF262 domain-containing protein [Chloroflexota bacterium]
MTDAEREKELQREIRGVSKSIRSLLSGVKYTIDYYQREYKWTTKQVSELLQDLTNRFLDDHEDENERKAVAGYGQYFLGSIVISAKNGQKFIIDGQQRLTTLTLLLIYLDNLQSDREDKVSIKEMIFSEKYGEKSFNLDVEERAAAMEAIFNQEDYEINGQSESVKNIIARYKDIESFFDPDIKDETLPYFIDWLIDNVHLVEITAYSDNDAYMIFETMNDRGLSLTPTDMLKGYLLANIIDEEKRDEAANIWKAQSHELKEISPEEVSDFLKAWLRSQYAQSIRERKKNAKPRDFDRLGTEFHRWVRDHKDIVQEKENIKVGIGLTTSDDFYTFIKNDFTFYGQQYLILRKASSEYLPGLEDVFHIAQLGLTLQYPVILAPLTPDDDKSTIQLKIQAVSTFLEIVLARRLWNWHSINYSTMQYTLFLIMREIRRKSLEDLIPILVRRLDDQDDFDNFDRFSLHKKNRYMIHRLLARMTDTIERGSGQPSHYLEYINVKGDPKNPYEVEHIWANHPERHTDEFNHPFDFSEYRNRIGGLLLLPKKFNASYNDCTYQEKYNHYYGQNLLAQSLSPQCYAHNPGFLSFIKQSGLPFKPHEQFKKADLDERQALYIALAKYTWNPDRLRKLLEG